MGMVEHDQLRAFDHLGMRGASTRTGPERHIGLIIKRIETALLIALGR
jgi:hypothetical protein